MNPSPQPGFSRFTPLDPIRVLKQYRVPLVIAGVLGIVAGFAITFVLARTSPEYTATALLRVSPPPSGPYTAAADQRMLDTDELALIKSTEIFRIQSDEILMEVLSREDVKQTSWYQQYMSTDGDSQRLDMDALLIELRDVLDILSVRGTSLIQIAASLPDKEEAPVLANTVSNVYLGRMRIISQLRNSRISELFTSRRNRMQQQVNDLDRNLEAIMEDGQLTTTDPGASEAAITYRQLLERRLELEEFLAQTRIQYQTLLEQREQGTFEPDPEDRRTVESDPFIRSRDERILGLKEELRVAKERFGPDHRAVRSLELRIEAIEAEKAAKERELLNELEELNLARARSSLQSLEANYQRVSEQLAEASAQMRELNRRMADYHGLQDERDRRLDDVARIEEVIDNMALTAARPDAVQVDVQQPATEPTERSFPQYSKLVPGATFLFVALAAGLVFLKELLDQRIKTPSCVKLLPPCDLLGVIPRASEDPTAPDDQSLDLVVARHPEGLLAESFRQLRVEVMQHLDNSSYHTLMVVGAQPESGVSRVATNLAASAALNGRSVVVLDANFRRSSIHEVAGLDRSPGLGELLAGSASLDQVVRPTEVDNLSVVTAGEAGAAAFEQLQSLALRDALRQLESRFDLVLIDAPPLSIVGDSLLLADRVDAIMVVVRAMQERRGLVARVMRQLDGVRSEMIGLVLNDMRSSAGGYFRRNYRQFYDYQNSKPGDSRRGRARTPAKPASRETAGTE